MVKLIMHFTQLKTLVEKSLNSPIEKVFIGIGRRENDTYVVKDVYECPNIAEEPSTRFKADPLCIYEVYKRAESLSLEIALLAHSHPAPPVPSAEDYRGMRHWPLPWLIVNSLTGEYKAWILDLDKGALREVVVEEVG